MKKLIRNLSSQSKDISLQNTNLNPQNEKPLNITNLRSPTQESCQQVHKNPNH